MAVEDLSVGHARLRMEKFTHRRRWGNMFSTEATLVNEELLFQFP